MIDKVKNLYRGFEIFCDGCHGVEPQGMASTYTMGVTKIHYDEKENVLHVHLRRPGLLIGRAGSNIDKLEKWLECKIHIHEIRQLWEE